MIRALITGVTGQDGSYLAEWLLEKGYEVHGVSRTANASERSRISHLLNDPAVNDRRFFLHHADLNDPATPNRILTEISPDEIYHLAGQSHVGASFEKVEATCEITAKAVARQFTLLCRKLELFGGELLAIDGSKFAAVNARDQNFNADKLQDLIARADARMNALNSAFSAPFSEIVAAFVFMFEF
jgi:UDP-glucose 4-epimerase